MSDNINMPYSKQNHIILKEENQYQSYNKIIVFITIVILLPISFFHLSLGNSSFLFYLIVALIYGALSFFKSIQKLTGYRMIASIFPVLLVLEYRFYTLDQSISGLLLFTLASLFLFVPFLLFNLDGEKLWVIISVTIIITMLLVVEISDFHLHKISHFVILILFMVGLIYFTFEKNLMSRIVFKKNSDYSLVLEKSIEELKLKDSQYKGEIEIKNKEEQKRIWISEGLTFFNNLLISNSSDLDIIDVFTSELTKYVDANQTWLFLLDQESDTEQLVLKSCYAYDRKKYLDNKIIQPGQGLVGQAYIEKSPIILKKIPDNYVNITSGLGKATPKSVIIMPLSYNNNIEGVLEMASFKEFTPSIIEFTKQIGEILAAHVNRLNVNSKTKKLLHESQLQTEQLQAQEEEMRQNMEEMEATQEDIERKGRELRQLMHKLENNQIIKEIDILTQTIETELYNSKMELSFLSKTPPISGIIRAKLNDGIDPEDQSSVSAWSNRLSTIISNLLEAKQAYKRIWLVDGTHELITGLENIGGNITRLDKDFLSSFGISSKKESLYIGAPKTQGKNAFTIVMCLPILYESTYEGYIGLELTNHNILEKASSSEKSGMMFQIKDQLNSILYSSLPSIDHFIDISNTIVLNKDENYYLKIEGVKKIIDS